MAAATRGVPPRAVGGSTGVVKRRFSGIRRPTTEFHPKLDGKRNRTEKTIYRDIIKITYDGRRRQQRECGDGEVRQETATEVVSHYWLWCFRLHNIIARRHGARSSGRAGFPLGSKRYLQVKRDKFRFGRRPNDIFVRPVALPVALVLI